MVTASARMLIAEPADQLVGDVRGARHRLDQRRRAAPGMKQVVGRQVAREQAFGGDRRRAVDQVPAAATRPRTSNSRAQHVEHADRQREQRHQRARLGGPHRPQSRHHRRGAHLLRIDHQPQQTEHRQRAGGFDHRGQAGDRHQREPAPALARRQPSDHRSHVTQSRGTCPTCAVQLHYRMQDLTSGSLTEHLLKTTSFMLVSMVFQTLYVLVDLFWMGRLGTDAIARGRAGRQSVVRRDRDHADAQRRRDDAGVACVGTEGSGPRDFPVQPVAGAVDGRRRCVFFALAMRFRHQYAAEPERDRGHADRDRAVSCCGSSRRWRCSSRWWRWARRCAAPAISSRACGCRSAPS